MQHFEFKGDWEFSFTIKDFSGFQSRQGPYASQDQEEASDGTVKVRIEDKFDEDPDPLPEQVAAINYLLDNSETIVHSILSKVKDEYPVIMEAYGAEEFDDQHFLPVREPEDVRKILGISTVHVLVASRDGVAYTGYECGCNWDEEHGLGILMHKNRVLGVGGVDEAFNSWEAYKDNGTYEEEVAKSEQELKEPPPFFKASPKYGKLKPSQQLSNDWYDLFLIANNFNSVFIHRIESGERDVNYINGNNGADESFLERAVSFKNYELVDYLLAKGANVSNAIQPASVNYDKTTIEKLLKAGADINEFNRFGQSALSEHINELVSQIRYRTYFEEDDSEGMLDEQVREIERNAEFIQWLMEKGADPYRKNSEGNDCFWIYEGEDDYIVQEINRVLRK